MTNEILKYCTRLSGRLSRPDSKFVGGKHCVDCFLIAKLVSVMNMEMMFREKRCNIKILQFYLNIFLVKEVLSTLPCNKKSKSIFYIQTESAETPNALWLVRDANPLQ